MKKKTLLKVFSMAAVILTSVSSTLNFVSAETLPSCSESQIVKKDCANKFHVKNEEEFLNCINKAQDGDTIILENDITLKTIAEIKTSICLDLNGHQILATNLNWIKHKDCMELVEGAIKIRKTNLPRLEVIDKRACFGYGYDSKKIEGYVKLKIQYDDNLKVTIKNGSIKKQDGKNGENGKSFKNHNGYCFHNGGNGERVNLPVIVYCGTLNLSNVKIEGGNGGNGGDGAKPDMSLMELFISNIKGGKGGNGANGGLPILYDKHCKIIKDGETKLIKGKPGKGGKGYKFEGTANFFAGEDLDGEDGKDGKVCAEDYDEVVERPDLILQPEYFEERF